MHMENQPFKDAFSPVMEREIQTGISKEIVESTQSALKELGYKVQAKPRPINLFYLSPNRRDLITQVDNHILIKGLGS